jgi:hypothetical protein
VGNTAPRQGRPRRREGGIEVGTRADFYVGRGAECEWIGSIAWDGYPDGIDSDVLEADTEESYRATMAHFFASRDDVTMPDMGWPWPWDTSHTTDFAYALDEGTVYASRFGDPWQPAVLWLRDEQEDEPEGEAPIFHDMSERKNIRWDRGSGLMIISAPMDADA